MTSAVPPGRSSLHRTQALVPRSFGPSKARRLTYVGQPSRLAPERPADEENKAITPYRPEFRHFVPTRLNRLEMSKLQRRFLPGNDQPVPPEQKPFAHRRTLHRISAYGLDPRLSFRGRCAEEPRRRILRSICRMSSLLVAIPAVMMFPRRSIWSSRKSARLFRGVGRRMFLRKLYGRAIVQSINPIADDGFT
jgi:hypothetical protein